MTFSEIMDVVFVILLKQSYEHVMIISYFFFFFIERIDKNENFKSRIVCNAP